MTVIAWDGKTLAADKQFNSGGLRSTGTKIRRAGRDLVGCSGPVDASAALIRWYQDGAKKDEFPSCQKDKDRWGLLVVVTHEKRIFCWEQEPVAFEIEDKKVAFGSGRDYALAAMEMGASSEQAVLLASKFECGCGNGVDTLTLE